MVRKTTTVHPSFYAFESPADQIILLGLITAGKHGKCEKLTDGHWENQLH